MYWETTQQIHLLHTVLEACDPQEDGAIADRIICGLIEMDLVDMDLAPLAHNKWAEEWEGYDVPFDEIRDWYRTDDDIEDGRYPD